MSTDRRNLASIEITQRCNGNCPYCDQIKSDRDMPVSEFGQSLDHLIEEGVDAVALGGGEPTLHPALSELLKEARTRGLQTGLTTNGRAPALVMGLAAEDLLNSFGVSAGKGAWLELVRHPRAVVNLLLLHGGLTIVFEQATRAIQYGARCLLLLCYKGGPTAFLPATSEVVNAYSILTTLSRRAGIIMATDNYTRRRLQLTETCGEGFVRINVDGTRDVCCFANCEFRDKMGRNPFSRGSGTFQQPPKGMA